MPNIANINLKLYRTKFGITQKELSEVLGITEKTYSTKERYGTFTQQEMLKIRQFFLRYEPGISLDQIFLPIELPKV